MADGNPVLNPKIGLSQTIIPLVVKFNNRSRGKAKFLAG